MLNHIRYRHSHICRICIIASRHLLLGILKGNVNDSQWRLIIYQIQLLNSTPESSPVAHIIIVINGHLIKHQKLWYSFNWKIFHSRHTSSTPLIIYTHIPLVITHRDWFIHPILVQSYRLYAWSVRQTFPIPLYNEANSSEKCYSSYCW